MLKKSLGKIVVSPRIKTVAILFFSALVVSLILAIWNREYTALVLTFFFFPSVLILLQKAEASSMQQMFQLGKIRQQVVRTNEGKKISSGSNAVGSAAALNVIEEILTQLADSGNYLTAAQITDFLERFETGQSSNAVTGGLPLVSKRLDMNFQKDEFKAIADVLQRFISEIDSLAVPSGTVVSPSQLVSLNRILGAMKPRYVYADESLALAADISFDEIISELDSDAFDTIATRGEALLILPQSKFDELSEKRVFELIGEDCVLAVVFSDPRFPPAEPENYTAIVPGGLLSKIKVFCPTNRIDDF